MPVPASPSPATSLAARFAQRASARARRERWLQAGLGCAAALLAALALAMPVFLLASARLTVGWQSAVLPLVAGSFKAATYALSVAVPLGLGAAIWCARFAPPGWRALLKPLFELFEAVPAVVLGLIAALLLAPWLVRHVLALALFIAALAPALAVSGVLWQRIAPLRWQRATAGQEVWLSLPLVAALGAGALAAGDAFADTALAALLQPVTPWNGLVIGLMLGLAVMPTVFTLAEDALFAVPAELALGAQALGATRWQALWRLLLPVAAPGIAAALLLGFSRALGETMIVLMAGGNTPLLDVSPLSGMRSIAANLALEAPEAAPGSGRYGLLLLSALLLFGLCLLLNAAAEHVRGRLRRRFAGL
ncbi:MAG TPA: ABC transporter permease subunit [Tahibacter sp.]|uniref:ABC transporter permease subunit n=1 Tax=Tahibacter sp. TaxID=2056211 RepID=UPI002B8CF26B|nr:ABC transporter permease subunit [Tahibacter sp.]HSX61282.1 ABC transporter permease subunit [Tahibacter sp.]